MVSRAARLCALTGDGERQRAEGTGLRRDPRAPETLEVRTNECTEKIQSDNFYVAVRLDLCA